MRRLIVVGLLAAAVGISGCSSGGSSAAGGKVTLTLWQNYGTTTNAKATTELVKAYEAAHPDVTIKVVPQPADNYFSLLQATAISHNGPDLAVMWGGLYTVKYASLLTNLKGLVPAKSLSRVSGLRWYSTSLNDASSPLVVPIDQSFYMGFYNKTAFKKAGISNLPADWSELYGDCKALSKAGYVPIVYGNGGQSLGAEFFPWYDVSYIMAGLYSLPQWKGLYDGSIKWNSPKNVAALTNWAEMKSRGCTNSDVLTDTNNLGQFTGGKAAMIIDGPWDSESFTKAMGDNVGVFLPPFSSHPMHGVVQFPGDGFGITSYSQHKTQAAGFLNFLTTRQAATILNKAGDIPAVSGAPVSNPLNKAMLKLASQPGMTVYPMIDNVVQGDVVDAGSKILPSVLGGGTSPSNALSQLEQAWNQLPPAERSKTFK